MNHQGPPAAPSLVLGNTSHFDDQVLSKVTIWAREEPDAIRHWFTSLTFAGRPTVGDQVYEGISINMTQPSDKSLVGSLEIQPRSKGALYSYRSKTFQCPIAFKKKVRVKDVVDLIVAHRKHCYLFNPAGSGCLFWQLDLLKLFVQKGWIEESDMDTAEKRIKGLGEAAVPSQTGTVPWPPVNGTFYRLG